MYFVQLSTNISSKLTKLGKNEFWGLHELSLENEIQLQQHFSFVHRVVRGSEKWALHVYKKQKWETSPSPQTGFRLQKSLLRVWWKFCRPLRATATWEDHQCLRLFLATWSGKRIIVSKAFCFDKQKRQLFSSIEIQNQGKIRTFGWEVFLHAPNTLVLEPTDFNFFRSLDSSVAECSEKNSSFQIIFSGKNPDYTKHKIKTLPYFRTAVMENKVITYFGKW